MEYINIWSLEKCVLAVLVGCLFINPPMAAGTVVKGDTFPELSDFKFDREAPEIDGKVVLVDFWASWCVPCRASFPAMEKLYLEYKDQGFEIVAVSVDEKAKAYEDFAKMSGVTFPLLRDLEKKLVELCAIELMPTSFMLDKSGKVHAVHHGYLGKKSDDQYRKEIETLLAKD